MQWKRSSLTVMSLLYFPREAHELVRFPDVASVTTASVVLHEAQWRCSWGSGFGILKSAQQSLLTH